MIDRLAAFWSSKKPKSTKFWQWLSLLLTIAMIVYLVYAFTQGQLRLNQINWKAYRWAILAVLVIYLLSLVNQFFVWTRIISFHRKASWQDVDIYARMILMRSLPGGAWHWLGRISMYSGETDVPARVVLLSNFLEWALLTLSSLGIFFSTLPIHWMGFVLGALTFSAALTLAISWQPATRKWITRLAEGGLWLALYSSGWFLAAVILYIIVQAVSGPGQVDVWGALKASTLAGSLGMLVTMLPSSLGVREISMVWLLQAKLSPSIALLIALMLRIIYTLADAIWGLIGWLISYLILRNKA
jgi:hypothetical protein